MPITAVLLRLLIGLSVILMPVPLAAQATLGKDEVAILRTVHDAQALKSTRRIAVFLTGEARHDVSVLRQALEIQLQTIGYTIVTSEAIESAISSDFARAWNAIPPEIKADPVKRQEWLDERLSELNETEATLARAVKAEGYLTGTAVFGTLNIRGQARISNEKVPVESTEVVVTSLSLRLVSVSEDPPKPIFEAVAGFLYGGKTHVNASAVVPMLLEAR